MNGIHGIKKSVENRNELEIVSILVDAVASQNFTELIKHDTFFEDAIRCFQIKIEDEAEHRE